MIRHFGAYKAVVHRNDDPTGADRVICKVPQVLGTALSQWAAPLGLVTTPPPTGSEVTIFFLGGDINHPAYLCVQATPSLGFFSTTEIGTETGLAIDAPLIAVGSGKATMVTYAPSGDTTGATDVTNINGLINLGYAVQLLTTGAWNTGSPYYINSPILPVNQTRLYGSQRSDSSDADNYSAGVGVSNGTVIVAVGSFTGASGAIQMINNSSTTQNTGVDIANITLELFELSSSVSLHGMYVAGAWGSCRLSGVNIHRAPLDNLHMVTGTSGKIPDDWRIEACKFSQAKSGSGYGVYLAELADSWIVHCESSENYNDGWYVNYGLNNRFIGCKGENNGNSTQLSYGFHFTGLAVNQISWATSCSTHLNSGGGFKWDNSGPSGGSLGTYLATGCTASSDGWGAGSVDTSAGFLASGCKSRVLLDGCVADVGTYEGGTGPYYGAAVISGSFYMQINGGYFGGESSSTRPNVYDDTTNTHPQGVYSSSAF